MPIMAAGLAWTAWCAVAADAVAMAECRADAVRAALGLAAISGVLYMAGEPTAVISGSLLALAIAAARAAAPLRALGAVSASLLGGVALAAVALVPQAAFVGESERSGGLHGAMATAWSMHPLRLIELVWPNLLGIHDDVSRDLARVVADTSDGVEGLGPSWATAYVSAPVILLAVVAAARSRRHRLLFAVAAAFVVMALGRFTPLYGVYRTLFLPEQLVRYPNKHQTVVVVVIAALAGVGHKVAFERRPPRWLVIAAASVAAFLAVGAVLVRHAPFAAMRAKAAAFTTPVDVDAALAHVSSSGLFAAGATTAFAILLVASARERWRRLAAALAVAIVGGHVAALSIAARPTVNRASIHAPAPLLAPVLEAARKTKAVAPRLCRVAGMPTSALRSGPEAAMFAMRDTAHPNLATEQGIAFLPAYQNARSSAFLRLGEAMAGRVDSNRILSYFNVRWVVVPTGQGIPVGMHPVSATDAGGGFTLHRNDTARPRAFVTTRFRWAPNETEAFKLMASPEHDGGEAILEGSGAAADPDAAAIAPSICGVSSPRPEVVILDCLASAPSYAVLLDQWAKGWSATVDGAAVPIVRAEGVARSVRLTPGRHRIEFRFAAPMLRASALFSLAAWLAWGAAVAFVRRRGRRGRHGANVAEGR
jgi:hypothetical protein